MTELESKLKHYRLSQDEYEKMQSLLGREPEGVEWALFSAMWSEHCSYKSSRVHLKKFFNRNERVVSGPGENAGVIDLGEGERIAFKMESHNHPSFIEPFQGAATGVGGILRDVFTMGARPVAVANYLCFGEHTVERMNTLVDGVVRGIGFYGNCVGVPNLTGQTEFDESYNQNILVNAMAVGLFRPGEPVLDAIATGVGNLVVYVGAKTGRDGIHGASMASEAFDESSEDKKPTIQKGDPFFEKLLIESCLEVMQQDLVVAIQDMGAAGLTSSSFEMAGRGGVGMRLNLDKVPLRDQSMTPEDILLSESQERMLLLCKPEKLNEVVKVFEKWDLDAVAVGEILPGTDMELYWHNEVLTKINPQMLTEEAPMYKRAYKKWEPKSEVESSKKLTTAFSEDLVIKKISQMKNNSRKWIYEQYDQHVGARTVRDCSHSVGVLRLPDSGRALGMVLGCRPYLMKMDAKIGAKDAIARPALELAAKGFETLAVTDCLNYGNPEKPEIMTEFVTSVEEMSATCEMLNAPVISGNVSFYNETLGKNITSTPATGLVGLKSSVENIPEDTFQKEGSELFLARLEMIQTDGASYLGDWDDQKLKVFVDDVRKLALHEGVLSSRVIGKGGLPYALARMCVNNMGAQVTQTMTEGFVEEMYQVIFEVDKASSEGFASKSVVRIGTVGGTQLEIVDKLFLSVDQISTEYNTSWEAQLGLS